MTDALRDDTIDRRRRIRRCSACGLSGIRLVFADDRCDYCRPCFLRVSRGTRIQSIGRRKTDLDPSVEIGSGY